MRQFIPRDYQEEAALALWGTFAERVRVNPLICLPTGTGKASLLGMIIKDIYLNWPTTGTTIVLTHVKELVENDAKSIKWVWPQAPLSIYSAGAGVKDLSGRVIVAGIQSFAAVAHTIRNPCVVLIDEAHLVPADTETTYRKTIDVLRQANPNLVVIGLTATPFRAKGGMLTECGLFNHVAYDATQADRFMQFIRDGYLIRPVVKGTDTQLDITGVGIVGDDFNQRQLQQAVDRYDLTYACLTEVLAKASDRKKWLIFAAGVEHTEHVADMLNSFGIPTGFVHSKMKGNRDDELKKFESGEYRALVNNGILTTGYDCPGIDCIVILRPTRSNVLWIQILGRGTRPDFALGYDIATKAGRLAAIQASTKRDFLVLDFAGNTARLGPINDPHLPVKGKKGGGDPPMKVCPKCDTYNYARAAKCSTLTKHSLPEDEDFGCGHEFPPPELKVTSTASTDEVIADAPLTVELIPVDFAAYSLHTKPGKPTSIKVVYQCGLRLFTEWLCFEYEGAARKKAERWWRDNTEGAMPPNTCGDFLLRKGELRSPKYIRVWLKRGPRGGAAYPQILATLYEEPVNEPALVEE